MIFTSVWRLLCTIGSTICRTWERLPWAVARAPWRIAVPALAFCVALSAEAAIYRVKGDATGSNDGSTWANAFTSLQSALNLQNLAPGDQIWVAQGTYKPGTNRSDTFHLGTNGVAVLGGFAGSETQASQRNPDPTTNGTILSGDIDGDNVLNDDNSYHVVTIGSTVSTVTAMGFLGNLDGFAIKMGAATGEPTTQNRGGGIFIDQGSPRIRNCLITQCTATFTGGGIECANTLTAPEIRRCQFIGNTATGAQGRGGAVNANRSVAIIDTLLQDNSAGKWGGAVNVEFGLEGFDESDEDITFVNCQFIENTSDYGGGAYISVGGNTNIANCLFDANTAITGSLGHQGNGGGLWTYAQGSITNCTFVNCVAGDGGGGLSDYGTTFITVTNCIFFDNNAVTQDSDDIEDVTGLSLTVTHCAMEVEPTVLSFDEDTNIIFGQNGAASHPHFVNPSSSDYRLDCASDCINTGKNSEVDADSFDVNENNNTTSEKTPDLDLLHRIIGFETFDGLSVDMGAYEKQPTSPCTVADIMPLPCRNSVVDVDDLLAVINSWGECDEPENCPADVTGPSGPNGEVNTDDLLAVINSWGPCLGFTGDDDMPQSVDDCMDYCSIRCEDNQACWVQCVDDCVTALCEAEIINCED